MLLEHASEPDYPAIIDLVNAAYRGHGAVESWNIESGIIEGIRLTDSLLREDLAAKPDAHFLVHRDPESRAIIGTVWLEPVNEGAWYLGLFTIDPALQKKHLGRASLSAAEDFAKARGARSMRMGVLNVRDALIAWYERRAYRRTGTTEPYPYGDNRFGTHSETTWSLCFSKSSFEPAGSFHGPFRATSETPHIPFPSPPYDEGRI